MGSLGDADSLQKIVDALCHTPWRELLSRTEIYVIERAEASHEQLTASQRVRSLVGQIFAHHSSEPPQVHTFDPILTRTARFIRFCTAYDRICWQAADLQMEQWMAYDVVGLAGLKVGLAVRAEQLNQAEKFRRDLYREAEGVEYDPFLHGRDLIPVSGCSLIPTNDFSDTDSEKTHLEHYLVLGWDSARRDFGTILTGTGGLFSLTLPLTVLACNARSLCGIVQWERPGDKELERHFILAGGAPCGLPIDAAYLSGHDVPRSLYYHYRLETDHIVAYLDHYRRRVDPPSDLMSRPHIESSDARTELIALGKHLEHLQPLDERLRRESGCIVHPDLSVDGRRYIAVRWHGKRDNPLDAPLQAGKRPVHEQVHAAKRSRFPNVFNNVPLTAFVLTAHERQHLIPQRVFREDIRTVIDFRSPNGGMLIRALAHLDQLAFGSSGNTAGRWALYNVGAVTGAIVGFGLSWEDAERHFPRAWDLIWKRTDIDRSICPVMPLSYYAATPARRRGCWVGHSLCTLNGTLARLSGQHNLSWPSIEGLSYATKALALGVYGATTQFGVAQWANRAARTHTAFGELELLTAHTPGHATPESFTYVVQVDTRALQQALYSRPCEPFPSQNVTHTFNSGISADRERLAQLQVVLERELANPHGARYYIIHAEPSGQHISVTVEMRSTRR